ncbi:UDP-3-O-(3-hydroxymyristoyl)glucosamine N-acyltransferase [Neisseria sp. Ec49-e6-T10]|uniref:UDP-3-O-(3-hydroxymyristoyl)glucosamine N-acyltransferase n=1 Tax=Neisseria sp. Ec49-e6-T10 TaxID=3140744 RepID=UPI003EBB2B78
MVYKLSTIVGQIGGLLEGEDKEVIGIASLSTAQENQISFLSSSKYRKQLASCQAGTLIVTERMAKLLKGNFSFIITDDPYLYFAKLAQFFLPKEELRAYKHPSAVIGQNTHIPDSCRIDANVVIGDHVQLGEFCHIGAGCVIADNVVIGQNSVFFPNVTVYEGVRFGEHVRIHAGCVIGSDGFGLAWDKENDQWFKIPQTGSVRIGDYVEVGANSTIDRGALDDTIIENDAKIDNLVQVGHNVYIGKSTAVAGCVGIAGSTHIGSHCLIGGAVMFSGHIEIEDHTQIGGGTAVAKSLSSDHYASFFPLMKHKEWVKNAIHLRHLSDMADKIKQLEHKVEQMNQDSEDVK